jgi:argininosuccinate lyase
MQEDKEAVFDSFDTVSACLQVTSTVLRNVTVNEARTRAAASTGYMNATELADYLVRKGMAFREAHEVVGKIVMRAVELGKELEQLTVEELREFSTEINADVYGCLTLEATLNSKSQVGGTARQRVNEALETAKQSLSDS